MNEQEPKDLLEKIGKIALYDENKSIDKKKDKEDKPLLWGTGYNIDTFKEYLPKLAKTLQRTNPEENDRKSNREHKTYECPINYAPLDSNMFIVEGGSGQIPDTDVASILFSEIMTHGRQKIDELLKHIGGIDPNLLQIVINALVQDDWMYVYEIDKQDNLPILEWTDINDRNKKLGIVPEKALEHIDPENKWLLEQLPPISAAYGEKKKIKKKRLRNVIVDIKESLAAKIKVKEVKEFETSSSRNRIKVKEVYKDD